jgi:RNA polymerase sigma factor (sigma-70 family)
MNAIRTPDPPRVEPALTYEDVFRDHVGRVQRHAYRLTRRRHDAEDLTQEVFLRVFRYLPRFDPDLGSIEGWLYRITANCFLDRVRSQQRPRIDLDPDVDNHAGLDSTPHQLAESRVLDADIEAALSGLTQAQTQTILLHDVDGLDYRQIAAELGIAAGTVGSRLCRGHAALRAALAHRAPGHTAAA